MIFCAKIVLMLKFTAKKIKKIVYCKRNVISLSRKCLMPPCIFKFNYKRRRQLKIYLIMKKVLLIVGLALTILSASAQEKVAKDYTHQAGDIALGIDATPFLQYMGNAFNSNFNAAPAFSNGTILGKYFLSEKSAIRVQLDFGFNKTISKQLVDANPQPTPAPTTPAQVEDVTKISNNNFMLGVGYELRRGEKRLQAFYGGGILLGANNGNGSAVYEYGNKLSANNTNFGLNRNTERKNGASFGFGLNGFVGVEYFITENISLGGQVGLALTYQTIAKGKTTSEYWDTAENKVKTTTTESYSSTPARFNFNTKGSGIFVSFYF